MKILSILFLVLFFSQLVSAQEVKKEIEGVVSYLTPQNIYVKFLSAKGIKRGDKIYIRKNNELIPILSVENSSSVSCVGSVTGTEKLMVGDKVIALVSKEEAEEAKAIAVEQPKQISQDSTQTVKSVITSKVPVRKERIDGRVQVSSYTNLSNLPSGNSTRLRYIVTMNGSNLGNSRLSMDTYISFAHQLKNWTPIKENIFNGLKVYDLNLKYEVGKSTTLWMGRKINPKISNLGAIDGLQFEVNMKQFYWGAVAGFRPDYTDYSFNKNLLEYGAFFGHNYKNDNGVIQTSLAGFNQTNTGKTDRRFLYFQHDNSLLKNLTLFFSSEVDLYKVIGGTPVNEMTLTSLYLMLNYRLSRKLSISTSYDNRRNIIYYETYKNYIDVMLEDATRQGVQFRINYRPISLMNIGLSSSYWDRAGDTKPTKNVNGFLSFTQLPLIKSSASLTVNGLQTSYVDGFIYGIRLDNDYFAGKLNVGLNYRYVNYTYLASSTKLLEHIAAVDLSIQFTRKFSFSVNWEGTYETQNTYHQIYGSLIKRF